jgi:hypothetical protein
MESTESVTGAQHATPGEVLVCQIDERRLNSRICLTARGVNAEGPVQQTHRVAIQLLERLFCDAERLEIQIIPGCVTLGRFVSLFDAV